MKRVIIPLLLFLWLSLTFFYFYQINKKAETKQLVIQQVATSSSQLAAIRVKRVVDGDTIELDTGIKVRYIGINAPETVDPRRPVGCFGQEAKEENKKLVEGKIIKLEKDISETDKYGRLLRYVYVDSLFINDYLVRNGFAQVSTYPPDVKYQEQFITSQNEARANNVGLWKSCNRN